MLEVGAQRIGRGAGLRDGFHVQGRACRLEIFQLLHVVLRHGMQRDRNGERSRSQAHAAFNDHVVSVIEIDFMSTSRIDCELPLRLICFAQAAIDIRFL
jgi:hypothetical protein